MSVLPTILALVLVLPDGTSSEVKRAVYDPHAKTVNGVLIDTATLRPAPGGFTLTLLRKEIFKDNFDGSANSFRKD